MYAARGTAPGGAATGARRGRGASIKRVAPRPRTSEVLDRVELEVGLRPVVPDRLLLDVVLVFVVVVLLRSLLGDGSGSGSGSRFWGLGPSPRARAQAPRAAAGDDDLLLKDGAASSLPGSWASPATALRLRLGLRLQAPAPVPGTPGRVPALGLVVFDRLVHDVLDEVLLLVVNRADGLGGGRLFLLG